MKQLISPPIQLAFWLVGGLLLGMAAWNLLSLKLRDESQVQGATNVNVNIPDIGILDAPGANTYTQMIKAPLFWAERQAPEPAKIVTAPPPSAAPADIILPDARLIGIIDMGDHRFAVMQDNATSVSQHLKEGDTWNNWTISRVEADKLVIQSGAQTQEIPLVGDFTAPKENPQVAQARVQQQQKQRLQQAQPAVNAPPATVAQNTAGLPLPANAQPQQAPAPLSAEEALEARQRLMASRWGMLAGKEEVPPPLNASHQ